MWFPFLSASVRIVYRLRAKAYEMDDEEQLHRSLNEYSVSRVEMALSALKWILSRKVCVH